MTASVNNYYIGKGVVSVSDDGNTWTDVGNVPEFEFTPELEELEHFSSREGTRTRDKTVVVSKSATLRIVLEEWSQANLLLATLGELNSAGDIDIFARNAVNKQVRFVGANEVGRTYTVIFPSVDFIPSGSINFISDEWGQFELTGNVNAVAGSFGTIEDTTVSA
jgi:hypothetical protein